MDTPKIDRTRTATLAQTRFLSLYDLAYEDGSHYYVASRRGKDELLAVSDPSGRSLLPDAVSCCLVLETPGDEPRMVLFYEYRYPTGAYLLSIPSGLIDPADRAEQDPLCAAMAREIGEECGLAVGEGDRLWVVNPLLYNTPGLTDESTALLCAVVRRPDAQGLTQRGAQEGERFDGFELLTKAQVQEVLARGADPQGTPYPLVAWAAMTYFACDLWREPAR